MTMFLNIPTTPQVFADWLKGTDFGQSWLQRQRETAHAHHRGARRELDLLLLERDRQCHAAVTNEAAAQQRVREAEDAVQQARVALMRCQQETRDAQRYASARISELERTLERTADAAYPEIHAFIREQEELRTKVEYVALRSGDLVYPDKYAFLVGRKAPAGYWTNAAAVERLVQASLNAVQAARALVYADVDDIHAELARLRATVPGLETLEEREPTFQIEGI